MGLEFYLAAVPAADIDMERANTLHRIVDELNVDELADYFDDQDEMKTVLHDAIDTYVNEAYGRDVKLFHRDDMPYPFLLAGEMSFGNDLTEAFEHFWLLEEFAPIYAKLVEWAKLDALKQSAPNSQGNEAHAYAGNEEQTSPVMTPEQ